MFLCNIREEKQKSDDNNWSFICKLELYELYTNSLLFLHEFKSTQPPDLVVIIIKGAFKGGIVLFPPVNDVIWELIR